MRCEIRERLGTYVASSAKIRPIARVWPNGEFSVGYARSEQVGRSDEEWKWTGGEAGLRVADIDARLECLDGYLKVVGTITSMSAGLSLRLLTLSNPSNSHIKREPVKYGLQGITGYGTKVLRSTAFLMERKYGSDGCVLGTFTVPKLERSERIALAQGWGVLTNRLVQFLRRTLTKAGRTPVIAGCVEIQTARLESQSEAYLHLHVVWPGYSNRGGRWAVDVTKLRAWWKAQLEGIIGRTLEALPRVETAQVKKSVEAYLGKYLSKGSGECLEGFIADLGPESVPGQWWFASKEAKAAVKEATLSGFALSGMLESYIQYTVTQGSGDGFEWIAQVEFEYDGRLMNGGWVGRLTRDFVDDLRAMLRGDA